MGRRPVLNGTMASLFDRRVKGRPLPGIESWLSRPFPGDTAANVLILYTSNAICRSQVAPFLTYGSEFRARHGIVFRMVPLENLDRISARLWSQATHVVLQPWFTINPDDLVGLCKAVSDRAPAAQLSMLDAFAPNDLRLARHLPEHLSFYIKKSLFRDFSLYDRVWCGDTNLVDYYSQLYGLSADAVDFRPPAGFVEKLRLGPNFFTAPRLMAGFSEADPPSQANRTIDLQTRLGAKGAPWYQAMRRAALRAAEAIPNVSVSPAGRVSPTEYMAEMARSRLCFSPFGYGELCWRDIEAFQTGAVLIKPSMDHLETLPDLYEAGETYLPVRWDFSDLGEVVRAALDDETLRTRVAQTAYRRVKDYIDEARVVDDMAEIFLARSEVLA